MNNFSCHKCNKLFSTKQSLDRHLNRKYKCDRKIICEKCGLEFKTKQHLQNHQKIKGDCLINKINQIQNNKKILVDNFVNYNTLVDKIYDLIELIKKLESNNDILLKNILNNIKNNDDITNIKIKIISNKIQINEVTIIKKIHKIKKLEKYCNKFMFNISNITTKNKFSEINEILNNINQIGMKKLPSIDFQLWKSYNQFHQYLSESNDNIFFCKIDKHIISIKNNHKIYKFEIGKVLLQDIML